MSIFIKIMNPDCRMQMHPQWLTIKQSCHTVWKNILLQIVVVLIALPMGSQASEQGNPQQVYTVGIVPQFDARRTNAIWRPILNELGQRTGLHFTLRGSATIPVFENEFRSGNFDFAYMNPYQVLLTRNDEGYIPLVRDIGKKLHGVIVVHKDSSIRSVKELDGKFMAFPSPIALGATLLTRSDMQNIFNVHVKPRFVLSHSSVYLNVALGQTIAGGGVQKTLSQQPANIRDALRVIHKTTAVSSHPFTAHPRVPKEAQDKVRNALLAMGQTPEGRDLLAKIPVKTIGTASINDYKALSHMGLERFYKDR